MNIEYTNKDYQEVQLEEVRTIIITDSKGMRYRIKEDTFGGLELMAEDGRMSIEPNVSNLVTIKTLG